MTTTAEIVTFRLKSGSDPDAFAQAARAMIPFLHSTGAMIARTLSRDEAGLWTDHISWTSRAAADAAAKQMFQRPEAAPVMALIDPEGLEMRHAAIYLTPE